MIAFLIALALSSEPPAHPAFGEDETCARTEYGSSTECKGTVAGVSYSYVINEDGLVESGSIDGPLKGGEYDFAGTDDPDRWEITTQRDKMDDTVTWYAIHHQTGLMLQLTPTGQISGTCIIGSDFPGRPIAVRVASLPALHWEDNCSKGSAATLRAELLKGGRLLTRAYHWPNDWAVDKEGTADNFDKVLKLYAFLRRL